MAGNVYNGDAHEDVFATRSGLTKHAIELLKDNGESATGPTARVARTIADLRESKNAAFPDVENGLTYKA